MAGMKCFLLLFIFLYSCSKPVEHEPIWNAFGEMAGEVTENSIVLQSSLYDQNKGKGRELFGYLQSVNEGGASLSLEGKEIVVQGLEY